MMFYVGCAQARPWQRVCIKRDSSASRCKTSLRSSRHPELQQPGKQPVVVTPRLDIEADDRYRRVDMSIMHAYQARLGFAKMIARGEPGLLLSEAALQIAAEDDAIVQAFSDRIERIVDGLCHHLVSPTAPHTSPTSGSGYPASTNNSSGRPSSMTGSTSTGLAPAEVLATVDHYLFHELRYQAPAQGRSGLPQGAVVDHPGVWEDSRLGYLNELLIRRKGHPAAIAILYTEVMRRLLGRGVIHFAVTMDTKDFQSLPRAVLLPDMALASRDDILNTCPSETLLELLRHLKRSYWPFSWDTNVDGYAQGGNGSLGGFRSAAKAAVGDEMAAALQAVSIVAGWRLERGIWTSPGAGDIRRCRAACERLVMMCGDSAPEERRDLAVILFHAGHLGAARKELRAYMDCPAFHNSDPINRALCTKMMNALQGLDVQEPTRVMSAEAVLQGALTPFEEDKLPLTW